MNIEHRAEPHSLGSPIYCEASYYDAERLQSIAQRAETKLNSQPLAEISIWQDGSIQVKRHRSRSVQPRPKRDWTRGKVTVLTENALKRFRKCIYNTDVFHDGSAAILTLTLPSDFVRDVRETKRIQQAVLAYLRRRQVRAIWVRALQERGAVHWHFILDRMVNLDDLKSYWNRIAGGDCDAHREHGVEHEPCKSVERWTKYMDYQNIAPLLRAQIPEWALAGNWWGTINLPKPRPLQVIQGTEADLEPAINALFTVRNARRVARGKPCYRDHGYGFHVMGLGPSGAEWVNSLVLPSSREAKQLDGWEKSNPAALQGASFSSESIRPQVYQEASAHW